MFPDNFPTEEEIACLYSRAAFGASGKNARQTCLRLGITYNTLKRRLKAADAAEARWGMVIGEEEKNQILRSIRERLPLEPEGDESLGTLRGDWACVAKNELCRIYSLHIGDGIQSVDCATFIREGGRPFVLAQEADGSERKLCFGEHAETDLVCVVCPSGPHAMTVSVMPVSLAEMARAALDA